MGFLKKLIKIADRVTDSWSTRMGLNHVLEKYGTVTGLKIDRKKRSIDLELELKGEGERVAVHVEEYEYDPRRPERIVLRGVSVSKPWMEQLAKDFVEGKVLEVPGEAAKYLPTVL